jgi:hypothetical protein
MALRDEEAGLLENATRTETGAIDLDAEVVVAGSDGRRSGGTPTTNETGPIEG